MNKIHAQLEPFDFESSPPNDNVVRVKRPLTTFENGEQYEGDWDELGRKDGKGILFSTDGIIYQGYWKEDKRNGRGRLILENGEIHVGEWKNYEQYGKHHYETGGIYEGQYHDGKMHGHGVFTQPDGQQYNGQYKND